jgi:hypothetical protein
MDLLQHADAPPKLRLQIGGPALRLRECVQSTSDECIDDGG